MLDLVFTVKANQLRREVGQLQPTFHRQRRNAEGCGDLAHSLAFINQRLESNQLIGRVHGFLRSVLGQAQTYGAVRVHQLARDGRVGRQLALLHQQLQSGQSATAGHHAKAIALDAFLLLWNHNQRIEQATGRKNHRRQRRDRLGIAHAAHVESRQVKAVQRE